MTTIKLSELFFFSCQGEGSFVGVPSIFLRVFGCNFQCSGFGMPRGEKSTEHLEIDVGKYAKYNELPLVHTGCDSFPSWDLRFKHLSPKVEVDEIAKKIYELLPNNSFNQIGSPAHLILTGGEPLLGWQRAYPDLIRLLPDLRYVTIETNGTQELHQKLIDFFNIDRPDIHVTFSVSSKLSGVSGEKQEDALQPENVSGYRNIKNSDMYFKFVCSQKDDLKEIKHYISTYALHGIQCPIYLMPVGGTTQQYFLNVKEVALLALENGYRYSPRIQVDIFKNAWAT